jgi:death-on-curing protein
MMYLSVMDALAINERIMHEAGGVSLLRESGALEGALMRPQVAAHYQDADLATQAALLIAGIALAHAFVDGNKRTALVAGAVFLQLNGFVIVSEPEEFGRQIETLVSHREARERAMAGFVDWIGARLQPFAP